MQASRTAGIAGEPFALDWWRLVHRYLDRAGPLGAVMREDLIALFKCFRRYGYGRFRAACWAIWCRLPSL